MSIELNKINQSIVVQESALLQRPRALGVVLALAIASSLELSDGPVPSPSTWYNLSYRTRVNEMISAVNECYIVPTAEVLQLVEGLYCMRLHAAFNQNKIVKASTTSFLSYFTGADRYLTEEQLELLDRYRNLAVRHQADMCAFLANYVGQPSVDEAEFNDE